MEDNRTIPSTSFTRRTALKLAGCVAAAGLVADRLAATPSAQAAAAGPLDTLVFGDTTSETAHSLSTTDSVTITGALEQTARRFTPSSSDGVWGGTATFTMAVDEAENNYVTVKMWGGEAGADQGQLMLLVEGALDGWYFLGEVDALDIAADDPRCDGRFYYHTLPIPYGYTSGSSSISLSIISMGEIYNYASTAADWYGDLTVNSRAVYSVYTHSNPYFDPSSSEVQGSFPAAVTRSSPTTADIITALTDRVNSDIDGYLSGTASGFDLWQVTSLAEGYQLSYTPAYQSSTAVSQVVAALDAWYVNYQSDSSLMTDGDYQWEGFGKIGWAIVLLGSALDDYLSEDVTGVSGTTRLSAYESMLVASRDYWRQNMPQYTAQMLMCAAGIYECNRGLSALGSSSALAEPTARGYVYQAVGIDPWLGPEDPLGTPTEPLGDGYYQYSAAGLSKELGYVGNYGEFGDWVTKLYKIVTTQDGVTDTTLYDQCVLINQTRAYFRYPDVDDDGYTAMRLQSLIGWRDVIYPGPVLYDFKGLWAWDGHPLTVAAAYDDPTLNGYAQQMFTDNQYGELLDLLVTYYTTRVSANLVTAYADYQAFTSYASSDTQLPTTSGQPDFLWVDPDNGVFIVKNGTDLLYATVYWRAWFGINNLARVHLIQPDFHRSATIYQYSVYDDSGLLYTTPDWLNQGHGGEGFSPPSGGPTTSAWQGIELPVAAAPAGAPQPAAGTESPFSGRALFYTGQYGAYQYGMNSSSSATYTMTVNGAGVNLANGDAVAEGTTMEIGPLSCCVIYISSMGLREQQRADGGGERGDG
jgi:hypothetical protein